MKKFINVSLACDACEGQLAIVGVQIDFVNCGYILFCECITCGEEITIYLSLQDFINLNQLIVGESDNETNN